MLIYGVVNMEQDHESTIWVRAGNVTEAFQKAREVLGDRFDYFSDQALEYDPIVITEISPDWGLITYYVWENGSWDPVNTVEIHR